MRRSRVIISEEETLDLELAISWNFSSGIGKGKSFFSLFLINLCIFIWWKEALAFSFFNVIPLCVCLVYLLELKARPHHFEMK